MSSSQPSTAQAQRVTPAMPQQHDAFELFEASHAVYVRIAGCGDAAYGPAIIDILERTLARGGRMSAYFDFEHMESYDGALREQVQAWFRANMESCDEINVLARSPLVAAGVQIANMVLKGRIHSVRNISELQTRARAQGIDFN